MSKYISFNYFSFQGPYNYDGQYQSMNAVFTEEELANRDDTLRVADEIELQI